MKLDFNNINIFKWADLNYFEFENQIAFDALKNLNLNQEKSLSESKVALDKNIEDFQKSLELLSKEEQESYVNQKYYWDEVIINELQLIQRYSSILSIFSFYESRLKMICELIEGEFELKVKIKKINNYGSTLNKYWIYLNEVFEIKNDDIQKLFSALDDYRNIRNAIAHKNGMTREKIVSQEGLILNKIGDEFQIEISEIIFIKNLLQNIETFMSKLLIEIDKRYYELKSVR